MMITTTVVVIVFTVFIQVQKHFFNRKKSQNEIHRIYIPETSGLIKFSHKRLRFRSIQISFRGQRLHLSWNFSELKLKKKSHSSFRHTFWMEWAIDADFSWKYFIEATFFPVFWWRHGWNWGCHRKEGWQLCEFFCNHNNHLANDYFDNFLVSSSLISIQSRYTRAKSHDKADIQGSSIGGKGEGFITRGWIYPRWIYPWKTTEHSRPTGGHCSLTTVSIFRCAKWMRRKAGKCCWKPSKYKNHQRSTCLIRFQPRPLHFHLISIVSHNLAI